MAAALFAPSEIGLRGHWHFLPTEERIMKNSNRSHQSNPSIPILITECFDPRTLANMEAALDRACANVSGGEKHRARRRIAARIARCARMGHRTLAALSQAGQTAAAELRQREAF
jgi:hypothetical protein